MSSTDAGTGLLHTNTADVLLADGTALPAYRADYQDFYYSEFLCSADSYEFYIDIGVLYAFDKDSASNASYFAEYLGNCAINQLTLD